MKRGGALESAWRRAVGMTAVASIAGCAGTNRPPAAPFPHRPPAVTPDRPSPIPFLPLPAESSTTPALRRGVEAQRAARLWADSVLRTLSRREKAAQLVWPWILGDYVAEGSKEWRRTLAFVAEERVGGVIMSVGAPTDIAVKVNALQRASALPLLVSADLETGVGFRARAGFFVPNAIDLGGATTFPLQMALGAAGDTALAYAMGRVTALEARALGMHVAFGPDLDVNNNPANPVIGARSLTEDPALAARLGAALVRGTQDYGVMATGKHFPGHGDTETNSHLALASVTATRARLDSVELVPFKAAIRAGVGAIMTFHGFFPALDTAQLPATLSPRVMTTLLREELGFSGLLVTDAMDMKGVVDRYGAAEACKRAVAAGNDVLLMPADIHGAIEAVAAGVAEGRYDENRLDQSVRRILVLKHLMGIVRSRLVDVEAVRRVVGDSSHLALADTIAARGIVLARDTARLVPLVSANGRRPRILSVTYARRADLGAGVVFNGEIRGGAASLRTAFVSADDVAPDYARVLADAAASDVVVVGSYVNLSSESATADAPRAFVAFVNDLLAKGTKVLVVSYGTPYLIQQLPSISTYAIAWGGSAASQRAAARALLGTAPITGRLPISIPPSLPLGAGETRPAGVP